MTLKKWFPRFLFNFIDRAFNKIYAFIIIKTVKKNIKKSYQVKLHSFARFYIFEINVSLKNEN